LKLRCAMQSAHRLAGKGFHAKKDKTMHNIRSTHSIRGNNEKIQRLCARESLGKGDATKEIC